MTPEIGILLTVIGLIILVVIMTVPSSVGEEENIELFSKVLYKVTFYYNGRAYYWRAETADEDYWGALTINEDLCFDINVWKEEEPSMSKNVVYSAAVYKLEERNSEGTWTWENSKQLAPAHVKAETVLIEKSERSYP